MLRTALTTNLRTFRRKAQSTSEVKIARKVRQKYESFSHNGDSDTDSQPAVEKRVAIGEHGLPKGVQDSRRLAFQRCIKLWDFPPVA